MGGCKKDPPIPKDPNCQDLDFAGCGNISIPVLHYDSTMFQAPCINPNDPNEFCYLYKNSNNSALNGLYKYTISTGVKQQLTTGLSLFNQPKWGKNGWILLNVISGGDREIYKIKANGDSLTQVTTGKPDLFPEWNADCSKIIFNRAAYLGSPNSQIFIADKNGVILDSISNQYFNLGSCNKFNELACPPKSRLHFGVTRIDLASKAETLLYNPADESNSIQGLFWHPNGEKVYFTTLYGGLYSLNQYTKDLAMLKGFCGTKRYSHISIAGNGSFILVERIDGRVQNCEPYFKSTIYKVSIDGKSEEKITME